MMGLFGVTVAIATSKIAFFFPAAGVLSLVKSLTTYCYCHFYQFCVQPNDPAIILSRQCLHSFWSVKYLNFKECFYLYFLCGKGVHI